jgi:Domain of unknown function (DUF4159)
MRRHVAVALLIAVSLATVHAYAQNIILGGSRGGVAKWARAEDFDGSFHYCRGFYTSVYREAGGMGWWTDYPAADNNFSVRLSELTRVQVKRDGSQFPRHVVVQLSDPLLYRCPMLFMEDVGTIRLEPVEVENLRAYFLKGGFLWVDDFWGTPAWRQWAGEIHKALPEYQIFDIAREHPIRHMLFPVDEVEQTTNINNWLRTHDTSERGDDSPHANFRGIANEKGRIMVVMTHNTDFGDTWERESESPEFFARFSPKGYALGVDVMLYAMTH